MSAPGREEPPRPKAAPRRRRRPGRLRRWVLRPLAWLLLLIVVLLAVAVWYLYRPAVQRQLLERLIPRVEEYIGREIRVGRVRYSLYPLWLELRDVSVGGPTAADPPILTARRVMVLAEIRELRRPVLHLQEVRAEGIEVFVHRFADGTDNWPRRRRRPGPPRERPYELDITALTVSGGVLRLEDEQVDLELAARHVRIGLLGAAEGDDADLQGRVVCEQVEVRLPHARPYRAAMAAKVAVQRDGMEVLAARVSSPEATVDATGRVRWRGTRFVDLDLTGRASGALFDRLGYTHGEVDGAFTLDGDFYWQRGSWRWGGVVAAERLRALRWELSGLEAKVEGTRDRVRGEIRRAAYRDGEVGGWVEVTLPRERPRRRGVQLQLRLAGIDAEPFLADSQIPVGDLGARLAGTLDFQFVDADWRHGSGSADLRLAGEPARGLPLAGPLALRIDQGVLTARDVRLAGGGQTLHAAASYVLASESGTIDYRIESSDLGPLSRAIPTRPAADGGLPLWLPTVGRGELSGTLALAPQNVQTELSLRLVDAVARGIAADRAEGTLSLSSRGLDRLQLDLARGEGAALIGGAIPFDEGPPWSLELDVAAWPVEDARAWLEFPLPVSGPFTGMVTLAGAGGAASGTLEGEVEPARLYELPLAGLGARLAWDDQRLDIGHLTLRAAAGSLVAAGEMALPGNELRLTVAASDLDLAAEPLAALAGGAVQGGVSFVGEVGGTLELPAVRGELVGERLRVGDRALSESGRAALNVDWSDGRLHADGSLLGLIELSGGGELDLARADLVFTVASDELGELAALIPAPELPPISGSAAGELRIAGPVTDLELALRLDRLALDVAGTPLVAGEPIRLRLRGGTLRLESLYLRDPASESEVIVAGSAGLGADRPLDLRLQGVIDNRWLAGVVPWFALSGLTDVLATLRGTADEPRVSGQAAVRPGARLTSEALPLPIEGVEAVLLFYPDRLVVDILTGEIGGGALRASGQLAWPRAEVPADARFQVGVRGATLRWPEDWQLRGDGDLVWTLAGEQQLLRGVVTLDRALYLRDVEVGMVQLLQRFFRHQREEVGSVAAGAEDVQLNLQVTAPGAVRIRNNLADVRASAELTVRGSLARPLLFGEVEAEQGGRLVYADNEYRVERATLTFANPYRLEPLLDLEASTRVANYDVRLTLVGSLERLNASFSSDPPLPELEVLSLLLSGSPGRLGEELTQLDRDVESGGSAAEGLLIGQAASIVTSRVSTLFGFDAFRIEPLSRSGESVSSARVTVGKRLSSSVYLTYSYDPSSTGGQRFQVEWEVTEGLLVLLTQEQDSYAVDVLWERRF